MGVRLFTAGGLAALDDLSRRQFDTLRRNAHASRSRGAVSAVRELMRGIPGGSVTRRRRGAEEERT